MNLDQMVEDVKSIKNECEVVQLLRDFVPQPLQGKIPYATLLENIAVKGQDLVDCYCMER